MAGLADVAPVVPHVLHHTTQPEGQQGRNETREQMTALNIPCVSANAEFHWFRELNFPFGLGIGRLSAHRSARGGWIPPRANASVWHQLSPTNKGGNHPPAPRLVEKK
jgi:hypothetical protein